MEIIEYEERVLIKQSDYQKVIDDVNKEGKKTRSFILENIYLDSDDSFIFKTKKMLRIRRINNKGEELTLKAKNQDGSTREINETLDCHPIIDNELNNSFDNYHEIAKLICHRMEVQYEDYLLVIDKNEYHGITDYDLEIESDSQQKSLQILNFYCKKYNLKYDPHYKTKSHRTFERVRELNKK